MMKLRNLDLIFNFCLVIDKTLELAENNGADNKCDFHCCIALQFLFTLSVFDVSNLEVYHHVVRSAIPFQ